MKVVKLYNWDLLGCPEIPLRHVLTRDESRTRCRRLVAFADHTGTYVPDELVNKDPTCLLCLAVQADDD
jgi:hypothetical protein